MDFNAKISFSGGSPEQVAEAGNVSAKLSRNPGTSLIFSPPRKCGIHRIK